MQEANVHCLNEILFPGIKDLIRYINNRFVTKLIKGIEFFDTTIDFASVCNF